MHAGVGPRRDRGLFGRRERRLQRSRRRVSRLRGRRRRELAGRSDDAGAWVNAVDKPQRESDGRGGRLAPGLQRHERGPRARYVEDDGERRVQSPQYVYPATTCRTASRSRSTVAATCQADLSAQASCEGTCNAMANCDVQANCMGGDVEVACNGVCHGQCDVTDPTLVCMGTCKGECNATAAVTCSGECSGSCDAPMWTGTCDAGLQRDLQRHLRRQLQRGCASDGQHDGERHGLQWKVRGHLRREGDRVVYGDLYGPVQRRPVHGHAARASATRRGGRNVQWVVQRDVLVHARDRDVQRRMPRGVRRAGEPADTRNGKLSCSGSAECHSNCQAAGERQHHVARRPRSWCKSSATRRLRRRFNPTSWSSGTRSR